MNQTRWAYFSTLRRCVEVPREGVEPSSPRGRWLLKPVCIPFHHLGKAAVQGFEPRPKASEAPILPLDDTAIKYPVWDSNPPSHGLRSRYPCHKTHGAYLVFRVPFALGVLKPAT